MTEHTVLTDDRRELRVLERGDPNGRAVLVYNGTPNSRLLFDPHAKLAEEQGIRLISYDRPGYGGSTPQRAAAWLTAPGTFARSQTR